MYVLVKAGALIYAALICTIGGTRPPALIVRALLFYWLNELDYVLWHKCATDQLLGS